MQNSIDIFERRPSSCYQSIRNRRIALSKPKERKVVNKTKEKRMYSYLQKVCDKNLDDNEEVNSLCKNTEKVYLKSVKNYEGLLNQAKGIIKAPRVTITCKNTDKEKIIEYHDFVL